MAKSFECPKCSKKLPVSLALKLTTNSKFTCPHCKTKLRPHREMRSLVGLSAGAFMAFLTLMIGHLYLIVRDSDPLTTYVVMISIAIVAFIYFAIATAKNAAFEAIGKAE